MEIVGGGEGKGKKNNQRSLPTLEAPEAEGSATPQDTKTIHQAIWGRGEEGREIRFGGKGYGQNETKRGGIRAITLLALYMNSRKYKDEDLLITT